MIVSIGIDFIEVARVREVMRRTPRFTERVFTPVERLYCDARKAAAAQHYAARFAAKEAALKALGTGWRGGIAWQDVEILSQDTGAPALQFHNRAREIFTERGANVAHISLSHTSEYAIAQVIFEQL